MKLLVAVFFASLLNGCFIYSAKDDCIYGLTSTQCFGEEYPLIAHYQKPMSLGRTDPEQRWKDIESCGGSRQDKHLKELWHRSIDADREGNAKDKGLWTRFENCLSNKGYIWIDDCGRKNSKTNKKICN